jgi:hypothetical protein
VVVEVTNIQLQKPQEVVLTNNLHRVGDRAEVEAAKESLGLTNQVSIQIMPPTTLLICRLSGVAEVDAPKRAYQCMTTRR